MIWTSTKTTVAWNWVLGGGLKWTQIIRVKSLLLPLCPACPTITKETCQWDPRVYSYSLPAPSELVGMPCSLGQRKSQSAWSELKGRGTREKGEQRKDWIISPCVCAYFHHWCNPNEKLKETRPHKLLWRQTPSPCLNMSQFYHTHVYSL